MFIKTIIVLVLLIIVASLAQALYFLLKDKNRSPRTVKALTVRIALSIGLFILLLLAQASGLIKPHGISERVNWQLSVDRQPGSSD